MCQVPSSTQGCIIQLQTIIQSTLQNEINRLLTWLPRIQWSSAVLRRLDDRLRRQNED